MFLCCTSLWIVLRCQWGSLTAAIHCEVIINDLLSRLIMSSVRENDLQTDLDPAGIHHILREHCNRQLCHILSSLLLMLMFYGLKWHPVIVFFLSCFLMSFHQLNGGKKIMQQGIYWIVFVIVLLEKKWQETESGRKWKLWWYMFGIGQSRWNLIYSW